MKKHGGVYARQQGFTLIEIAVVVVIIGLLLGGILKGQELIRNARAHNLVNQGDAVKAAVLGFLDRFGAYPGDFRSASSVFPDLTASEFDPDTGALITAGDDGDGNSRIGGDPDDVDDQIVPRDNELALVWPHLTLSGFISGDYDADPTGIREADFTCRNSTCLTNAFNSGLMLLYGNYQVDPSAIAAGNAKGKSLQLLSGRSIPVELISEVDSKVDDGKPGGGSFRLADYFLTNDSNCAADDQVPPVLTNDEASVKRWYLIGQATDCGGVYLF